MQPLTPDEVKASFVNCSKGQVKRMTLPASLEASDWDDLDFLGWSDPKAAQQAWLVAPHRGRLVGVRLQTAARRSLRAGSALCDLCHSVQPAGEVLLLVARKVRGQDDSVGTYMCSDLGCSLYARGKRQLTLTQAEPVGTPARIAGLQDRLASFLDRVLGAAGGGT